jgi:hemerythrin-like domain-containing protein
MSPAPANGRRKLIAATLGTAAALASARGLEAAPSQPIGDEGVGPNEDLMREHGVLRRILLVYEEAVRRLRAGEAVPMDQLHAGADVVRRFVEGYHEKLEEDELFPRFERARKLTALVDVLRQQHQAGRRLTDAILAATATAGGSGDKRALADRLAQFVRMYRPHAAREDTELFPGFRELVARAEYEKLGAQFEKREAQVLGDHGFERVRDEVSGLERSFGVGDLASFTPSA